MKKVSAFLTNGFETVEAFASIDLLRRAGIQVIMVSITGNLEVESAQNVCVKADVLLENYDVSDCDLVFLPGGPGTKHYEQNEKFVEILKAFYQSGKRVAAICAAPSVLGHLGMLEGKKATCFPGFEKDLYGAEVVDMKVVTDGMVTTGKGMGASIEMGLELVKLLVDEQTSQKISAGIQF